ncbi:MAG: HlyC/CorC family transporter [Chlamydiales bacterium]|nr:HlyC/CorC family transporter [Chlamydiia bacterium]MCP5508434.1 HlyC/CorC family transporter [Chlamydiales bacterium]
METIILLLALIFLTFSSGFFSSSEVAFFSLSSMKVRAFSNDKDKRKQLVANLLRYPRDLLVTIFMMNTLVNILLQNVASDMFGGYPGWTLKVGLPLVLTLVFGEVIPKNIGYQNNEWLALHLSGIINFLQRFIAPLRKITISVTTPVSRLLFFYLKKDTAISREELHHTLKASREFGVLTEDESELVQGYLSLQDTSVKEVMRPKKEILFYDIDEPLTKLEYLFVEQEVTRVPVCKGEIEHVLGILTAKQYFVHRSQINTPEDLKKVLRKPYYIPESTPSRTLLKRFEENNEKIAIVVDEYGSIAGVITHEDLAELVVGDITDLRDDKPLFTRSGENEIITGGRLELTDFFEIFGESLHSSHNSVTVSGWLIEQLGEIPKSGTKYETDMFFFHVLAADPNRIRRLYIRKKTA